MNRLNVGANIIALEETRKMLMDNILSVFSNNPEAKSEMLKEFNEQKDIFKWGNLNKDESPPEDLPLPQYGTCIKNARNRIHEYFHDASLWRKKKTWKPMGFGTWMDQVKRVKREILNMETRIHMVDAKEIEYRESIENFVAGCRQVVSTKYYDLLTTLVTTFVTEWESFKKIQELKTVKDQFSPLEDQTVDYFTKKISKAAYATVVDQRKIFHSHFEECETHMRFKDEFERKWVDFLESESKSSDHRVKEIVIARAFFNDKLTEAKKTSVLNLCQEKDVNVRQKWTEDEKRYEFRNIFDSVAQKVIADNKPNSEITHIYEQIGIELCIIEDVPTKVKSKSIMVSWFHCFSCIWLKIIKHR